jgi:superfamily I DNA/RNA helicase
VLQLLVNPHNDVALLALLDSTLSMRAGIGPKVVTALVALQTAQGDHPEPLWRILVQWARDPSVNTRTRNAVHNFVELFNQCAPAARPTGSASSVPCLLPCLPHGDAIVHWGVQH